MIAWIKNNKFTDNNLITSYNIQGGRYVKRWTFLVDILRKLHQLFPVENNKYFMREHVSNNIKGAAG